jgi:hypothetical protein
MRGSGWVRIGATRFAGIFELKQGVLRAQFNVGLCYRDGDGVEGSNRRAREWLRGLPAVDILRRVRP